MAISNTIVVIVIESVASLYKELLAPTKQKQAMWYFHVYSIYDRELQAVMAKYLFVCQNG